MKKSILFFLLIFLSTNMLRSQELSIQTFGNSSDEAIIFLHGGPGYNSVAFEVTTAKALAEKGYFVISYDRRGEGRNEMLKAAYTFDETISDLLGIYQKYQLKKACLIGHSFGGLVATYFTEQHPTKVKALVLVGAPISMQETFATILEKSSIIYKEKDDQENLNYLFMMQQMYKTSLLYSSYCFMHAMQNGFYSTKNPSPEAKVLYQQFSSNEQLKKHASKMDFLAPQGFWKNEKYTTISIEKNIKTLKSKGVKIYGLYAKEDGLFSEDQIQSLKKTIGKKRLKYWSNCSHNVFIDQQVLFMNMLKKWTK